MAANAIKAKLLVQKTERMIVRTRKQKVQVLSTQLDRAKVNQATTREIFL